MDQKHQDNSRDCSSAKLLQTSPGASQRCQLQSGAVAMGYGALPREKWHPFHGRHLQTDAEREIWESACQLLGDVLSFARTLLPGRSGSSSQEQATLRAEDTALAAQGLLALGVARNRGGQNLQSGRKFEHETTSLHPLPAMGMSWSPHIREDTATNICSVVFLSPCGV